jgi:hypothetical protein
VEYTSAPERENGLGLWEKKDMWLAFQKTTCMSKVVNSVPFRPEWSKHFIPIQKTK